MNHHDFFPLEWDHWISLTQQWALTSPGQKKLAQLLDSAHWAPDLATAQKLQEETHEILDLLSPQTDSLWGALQDLEDPQLVLENLSKGSCLSLPELLLLRSWLYAFETWSTFAISEEPHEEPSQEERPEKKNWSTYFQEALQSIQTPQRVLRQLASILSPQGDLLETASPILGRIYQDIRGLKKDIQRSLDQKLQQLSQQGMLQEDYIDIRDGHYVIPVKTSFQNEVEGRVHETSGSRQTLFIEPKEIAPLTSRLQRRQNDLLQEMDRILQEVSQKLIPHATEWEKAVSILAYWDATRAKAKMGFERGGKKIQVTPERRFSFKQTAHPLLWGLLEKQKIIRNDLNFGSPQQALLLTGPNTGGKTLFLKTFGLAALFARTGFLFPGTEDPVVPFFDSIFTDFGDPQSLENQLSSFSGHVFKFKSILEEMTELSLILMDELNSATDPQEGAAFGRAILEAFLTKNAMVVATTHDPQLKALAWTHPHILNASMMFDESSHSPTYSLLPGFPGRSHALETAERLGIPHAVIEKARSYLAQEHLDFEALLEQLEKDTLEAKQTQEEARRLKEEALQLQKEWVGRTSTSVKELLNRSQQKLQKVVESAQAEARQWIQELKVAQTRQEREQIRLKLNQTFQTGSTQLQLTIQEETPELAHLLVRPASENRTLNPVLLEVGAAVRVPKWKTTGIMIEHRGNQVKVALGAIQVLLPLTEVEGIPASQSPNTQIRTTHIQAMDLPEKLDLRGLRFEEAMGQLERYLDRVFTQSQRLEVTIIHGLGTGALREGTHKQLKNLPYIQSFRDAGTGKGGSGATTVEFQRSTSLKDHSLG